MAGVSIGNLSLIVSANISPLTNSLSRASGGISSFAAGIAGTLGGVAGGILSGLGTIGHAIHGVRAIIGLIDDTILAPVKAAARFEVVVASMSGMLGSMEKAQKVAADLFSFAGTTPFEATELLDAAKKMLAVGTSVNQVSDTIKVLGDISAGSGKDLNELVVVFSQVRSAGRLLGQDMLQFNQANIPLSQALAKRFGISELALRKLVEAGKVGFRDVAEELQKMTEAGGLFHKQMELRSGTLTGRWTKVVNEFKQGLIQIGDSMVTNLNLKPLLDDVLLLGQAFGDWMAEGGLQRSWAWIAGAAEMIGGKFLDLVDVFKIVGAASYQYFGHRMLTLIADINEAMANWVMGMGTVFGSQEIVKGSNVQWDLAQKIREFDALQGAIAGVWDKTKIGDSRAQFAAGVQSFQDWMAGLRAAAEAKKPGFWGSLFDSVRGSIAAGAGFGAAGMETKLGKTGAAERGSKEAESILARTGNAQTKLEKIGLTQAELIKKVIKATENVAAEVRRAAGEVIVDF